MKMCFFESRFQQDLPEPCKPTNNFYKGPKVFSTKTVNSMQMYLNACSVEFDTFWGFLYRIRTAGKMHEFDTKYIEFDTTCVYTNQLC